MSIPDNNHLSLILWPRWHSLPNNYRKRLSDTWWLRSMRLRTRLGHGQYVYLCKTHRRSIEIRANQIVGCWIWIIKACVSIIIIIIIITSLFREDDILSNTNYLSDIWSSMIKIMYLNYRQFVQYIQYKNVTFKSLCLGSTFKMWDYKVNLKEGKTFLYNWLTIKICEDYICNFPMEIPARTIQIYTWKNRNPSIYDLELLDRQDTGCTCMIDV